MYRGGHLVDLAPALDRGVRRFARRTTRRVGRQYRDRVAHHTPVAKATAAVRASFPSLSSWERSRGGRRPGELRDSWKVGTVDVEMGGEVFAIDVYTLDPVAPHVEYFTRPHIIRPKRPGGVLAIPTATGMVFATIVHHPGTEGAHMLATATAEIAAEWQTIAAEEWAHEVHTDFWRAGD